MVNTHLSYQNPGYGSYALIVHELKGGKKFGFIEEKYGIPSGLNTQKKQKPDV